MPVLREGTALKRGTFVVASLLGRGGFGEVYLARQPRMNRDVAIKVLNPNLSDDPSIVERFQREALAAAALRHPNVLPVFDFDFDEETGVYFLAMQYVPGGRTLKERLGAPMEPLEAARILIAVAGALDAAHEHGIVHRDVKPANVLIEGQHASLADFGIAHLGEMTGITATGMAIGTPVYMSPEQAMGRPVGPAADQYSLGVMAFEMLAGRPPFLGDSISLVMQHVNTAPPTVSQFNNGVPLSAAAAVAQALSKNPNDRFPTCTAFVEALLPGAVFAGNPSNVFPPAGGAMGAGSSVAGDSMGMGADQYFAPATAPSTPGVPAGATLPSTAGVAAGATRPSIPGVQTPTADSRVEAIRRAEAVKPALPVPIPVLAGGAVLLVVGILAAVFAMRAGSGGDNSNQIAGGGGAVPAGASPAAAPSPNAPVVALASPGRPTGTVNVSSNPEGAIILVDGEGAMSTPRGLNLVPGEYELTLQFPTYEDRTVKVEVVEGQTKAISEVLTPRPAAQVLEVAEARMGRNPYKDGFSMVRIETPANTFQLQDDINAVVYVRPKSKGIRDLPFTTTMRWQRTGGNAPAVVSRPYQIPKDAEEEYLHACAPARVLDPQGSNTPLTLEVLVDDELIASFQFQVNGGNPALAVQSPCDETTIRGPITHQLDEEVRLTIG